MFPSRVYEDEVDACVCVAVSVTPYQRLRILWRFSGLLPREKPLVRQ